MGHSLPTGRPAWAELTPEELRDKAHDAAHAIEAYFGYSSEDNNKTAALLTADLPDQDGWAAKQAEYADQMPEPDFDALYEQHLHDKQEQRDGGQPDEAR